MERKPRWVNLGGTHRTTSGEVVKKGKTFLELEKDIPKAFQKKFRLFDQKVDLVKSPDRIYPSGEEKIEKKAEKAPGIDAFETPELNTSTKFEIRRKSVGWYNIINTATGKAVNEKGLREEGARKLLKELT